MTRRRWTVEHRFRLIVIFVRSVDRNSRAIDQEGWLRRTMELLAGLFGGATAFPRARGVWRDNARGGTLVWDEPVVVHCYAAERDMRDIRRAANQVALGNFCRLMGRSTNQGEVGLVIDNVYHAVRPQEEAK